VPRRPYFFIWYGAYSADGAH